MAFSCSYSSLLSNPSPCGLSSDYPSQLECVAVKDCRKDVTGHLSTLKLSADEGVATEMNLLLARAGIFSPDERHYNLNICPRHRADFGIRWRTRKALCRVPAKLAVHKSKNARGSHRVDSRQSEYIFKNSDTLIPVGSPICKQCNEVLSKQALLNQMRESAAAPPTPEAATEAPLEAESPELEGVPGGELEDSRVLSGVMVNKDVTHSRMRRRIENPRIVLLDCSLEYKKGESQTSLEISQETDFNRILQLEEEYIQSVCSDIIAIKPDVVFTEKGVSDLAQHYLVKNGITAVRRIRKTDNNRIARACGATIVNRTEELKEEDVGTGAGLFEISKIGDEYFCFVMECKNPKACTILLRGPSKDILNEVERNLHDAMNVTRNVMLDPRLVPGGGAAEMALAHVLTEKSKSVAGVQQWPYKAVAKALEVIPRTLIQNCGANTIRTLTALRAKHAADGNTTWGVNGETGEITDMNELGVWDTYSVKAQTLKTAIETAMLLLRIDDIVSGTKKASGKEGSQSGAAPTTTAEE